LTQRAAGRTSIAMPSSVPAFRPAAQGLRPALLALAVLTLIRLAVAAATPLAPDEAYYWIWSRVLQPGYYDGPPMVALWIRAGTAIAGATPLGIRLLGPLSGALGSVLLWHAAEMLLPGRRAGLIAAALLNASLFLGVGTVIMTPDTPLLFFWVACLWALAGFTRDGNGWWLVVAALFAGAAFDSKYTAAFLLAGALLWLIWVPGLRRQWRTATPYWAALWGLQMVMPVVTWNRSHRWVSFLKQGGRLAYWHPTEAPRFLGELIGTQLGLATPLVLVLCAAGVALAARRACQRQDPTFTLLAAMTLPAVAVFVQHCFAGRVQGNWPAVVYPAAAIAAAALEAPRWRRLVRPAVVLGLAITAFAYLQATTGAIPLPARRDPTALRLAGWPGLAREVANVQAHSGASFVAATDYDVASELALHLPRAVTLIGVEPRWAWFELPHPAVAGVTGLLVRSLRRAGPPNPAPWARVEPLGTIWRRRGVARVEGFQLFRVVVRPSAVPMVRLPRP
jgi:4-amino-4-deoxy-L-arabinose transferase-like glycosyltransferase